jgi:predicted short-subunit dehydrogenase-like oxidoreductase (DUF2520 family)
MKTVSIIGIGRVGGALSLALPAAGYSIDKLVHRGEAPDVDSDIIFITTQDAHISDVAVELAASMPRGRFVYHTSGALSSKALGPLAAAGSIVGSIHPLVSISSAELGPERFKGAYFCVEGDKVAMKEARSIVTALGGIPFSVDTEFKTLYHAAAVTAAGHIVALFDAAIEMMTKCGLSERECTEILLPLVKSTVQNLETQSTAEALTGTFARADVGTFVEHLKTLNVNVSEDLLEIYLLLGERSLELATKQGVSRNRVDTMRTKVAIAKSKLKW